MTLVSFCGRINTGFLIRLDTTGLLKKCTKITKYFFANGFLYRLNWIFVGAHEHMDQAVVGGCYPTHRRWGGEGVERE
jgi:hypothetical protein